MTAVQRLATNAKSALATIWYYRILVASVFVVLIAIAFLFANSVPKQYAATANLLVVNGTTRDDPTLSSPDLPSIATSTVVLQRVEDALGLKTPLKTIKHSISVKAPAFRSSILQITDTDTNAEQAMLIANTTADELAKYYKEISTARFDENLRALDVEMNAQRERVHKLSAQATASGVAGALSDKGADAAVTRYTDAEMNVALAEAQLQGDLSKLSSIQTNAEKQRAMIRYEVLKGDPTYQDLQTNFSTTAAQLANTRAQFTSNYPALPGLEAKVKSLQSAMEAEERKALSSSNAFSPSLSAMTTDERAAAATIAADRAKVNAYLGLLGKERTRTAAIPSVEGIRLEREAAQAAFLSLASRRATALANRADALSLGSVVVVDRAIITDSQIGLSRTRLFLLFGLVVLALSIGSAFIAEQINPRLRRASQIEDLYGRPVVATIG